MGYQTGSAVLEDHAVWMLASHQAPPYARLTLATELSFAYGAVGSPPYTFMRVRAAFVFVKRQEQHLEKTSE